MFQFSVGVFRSITNSNQILFVFRKEKATYIIYWWHIFILIFVLMIGTMTTMAQTCVSVIYMKNCKRFACKEECRSVGICEGCDCSTVKLDTCCCKFSSWYFISKYNKFDLHLLMGFFNYRLRLIFSLFCIFILR